MRSAGQCSTLNSCPSRRASSQAGSEVEDRSVAYTIRLIVLKDSLMPGLGNAASAVHRIPCEPLPQSPCNGDAGLGWLPTDREPNLRGPSPTDRPSPSPRAAGLTITTDSIRWRSEVRHGQTTSSTHPSSRQATRPRLNCRRQPCQTRNSSISPTSTQSTVPPALLRPRPTWWGACSPAPPGRASTSAGSRPPVFTASDRRLK